MNYGSAVKRFIFCLVGVDLLASVLTSVTANVCYFSADMSGGGITRGPAGSNDSRIYVGNLPPDIRSRDVEDLFYKYGAIRDIDLKNRRGGPPFAFVQFEDPR